jgi:hypothetical protein
MSKIGPVAGFGVLAVALIFGVLIVGPVSAQEDTSSTTDTTPTEVSSSSMSQSTSDTASASIESTSSSDAVAPAPPESMTPAEGGDTGDSSSAPQTQPSEPDSQGLTLVHIIGTKYTDYFTDDSNTVSFPGDPIIDAHFSEEDAPTPTHIGLTWVHTISQNVYDTSSGDLEVGDYAVDANGTRLEKPFPTTFLSSTSTAQVPDGTTPSAPTADTTSTSSSASDSSTTTDQGAPSTPPLTDTAATTTP